MKSMDRWTNSSAPPEGAILIVKVARVGEFQDEYEEFFRLAYQDKVRQYGEVYARRWAYRNALKTLFFAALEWTRLILTVYSKIVGG
jgi:hypothetical protein